MKFKGSSADVVQDKEKIQNQHATKWWAIATFFGAGYLKPGPGTWASVAALLLWAAFAFIFTPALTLTPPLTLTPALTPAPAPALTLTLALTLGIAITLILGIPAATIVERESGRHDPGFVVIDEVIGQWVALLACPADWRDGLICLILFRLFDITKPFPVRRFERLPAGWGIVFDDVAAGLYALGSAALLRAALHHWF